MGSLRYLQSCPYGATDGFLFLWNQLYRVAVCNLPLWSLTFWCHFQAKMEWLTKYRMRLNFRNLYKVAWKGYQISQYLKNPYSNKILEQTFQHRKLSSVISLIRILRHLTFEIQIQKLTGLSLTSSGWASVQLSNPSSHMKTLSLVLLTSV